MDISSILIIPFAILLSLVFVGRIPGTQSGRSPGFRSPSSRTPSRTTRTITTRTRISTTRRVAPTPSTRRVAPTPSTRRVAPTLPTRRVATASPVRRTDVRRVATRRSLLRTTTPGPRRPSTTAYPGFRRTTRRPSPSTTPWWQIPRSTTPGYWQGRRSTTQAYIDPWIRRSTTPHYPWQTRRSTPSDFIDPWWLPTKKPKTSWEDSWGNKNSRFPQSKYPKGNNGVNGYSDYNRNTGHGHTNTTRGFSTGIAVGVSLLCIGLLAAIIVIVVYFKRRRDSAAAAKRQTSYNYQTNGTSGGTQPPPVGPYTSPTGPVHPVQPAYAATNPVYYSPEEGPHMVDPKGMNSNGPAVPHNFENPPPYDPQPGGIGFTLPSENIGKPMPTWDQANGVQPNAGYQPLANVHYPHGGTAQPVGFTDNAHKTGPLPYPHAPNMPPPQNIHFNAEFASDSTA